MPNINIKIRNKVAKGEYAVIVCDNSDYVAHFDFDAEWDAYATKTARFVYGGKYTDVVFSGNECAVPVMQDTRAVTVGVFAGDLHTTTPAYFACVPSILFGGGVPADPTPDVYNQIMELLNNIADGGKPATTERLGVIKVGENLKITEEGVLSVDATAGYVPSVQPDWNQNDTTAADYIKNRPFYADELLYVTLDGTPHIWYKVSSDIPSVVNPKSGDYINLWINGEKTTFTIRYDSETGYATNDVACCVAFSDDASIDIDGIALVLPERGTYFAKIEIGDYTQIVTGVAAYGSSTPEITWDGNTGTLKQLDAKFIPDMDSVVLKSSTAGSAKQFRITVDDSGAISATEVT